MTISTPRNLDTTHKSKETDVYFLNSTLKLFTWCSKLNVSNCLWQYYIGAKQTQYITGFLIDHNMVTPRTKCSMLKDVLKSISESCLI